MKRIAAGACLTLYLFAAQTVFADIHPPAPAGGPGTLRNIQRWSFDDVPVGGLPPGVLVLTGEWSVRAEQDAPSPPNVLCQTGDAEYPSLTLSTSIYRDLVMTARLKIKAERDMSNPTGGLIFRMHDKHHFYLARINTAEGIGNTKFYKYWLGERGLVRFQSIPLQRGRWYEMRVEMKGTKLDVYLDGQRVIEATDKTYGAGRVGLWVKNDSFACFDNIVVGELDSIRENKKP